MTTPKGLQLVWNGKDKIINHHNEVPFRILNEIPDKSFKKDNSNSTDNIIIRGDNLEGLKALKPYFYNSIKMVYIDPPYNTGAKQGTGGWIYSDRVDSPEIRKWFDKVVGDEHEDYSRHTKWLCMMYPRLKLLHELLKEDGVIFVSIDDNEVHHLRCLLDEIFGVENFISELIWYSKYTVSNDAQFFSRQHEYILCYAKNKERVDIDCSFPRTEKVNQRYRNPDNDPRGPWRLKPIHAKSGNKESYTYKFKNGVEWKAPKGTYARFTVNKLKEFEDDNRVWFGKSGKGMPSIKIFLSEMQGGVKAGSILHFDTVGHTHKANEQLSEILGKGAFDNPKSVDLIKAFCRMSTKGDEVILDSFAGSGTTGQSVLELNGEDGGRRRFILIQLDEGKEDEKINICDTVTAERVRGVIKKLTGGGFKYYEVNGTLKDEKGFINSLLSEKDLARFIMFIETQEPQVKLTKFNDYYKIGENNNAVFYLMHDKTKMLDNGFLMEIDYEKLRGDGRFVVVYAYGTLLDDEYLEENRENLRFMHLPNDLDKLARI